MSELRHTQAERAERLRLLHRGPELFVIPNPWDAGSAKLLVGLGFKALTTTSAGLAWAIGKPDGAATLEEALANARQVVDAVDIPVAADLENGFGDTPEDVAETILRAAETGLVGASIEDFARETGRIYDFDLAVERVRAAAEAAHSLGFPFQFVARCENHIQGIDDLDDTIRRLRAYEAAGADVLFAPGLPTLDAIRTVCEAVTSPVNVVIGPKTLTHSIADLAEAGVRRVSVGGAFSRVALTAVRTASEELLGPGTFGFCHGIMSTAELNAVMTAKP